MGCTSKNKEFQVPTDAAGKARYESAMKHVEWAKANGKSSEEVHDIFKKVMEGTGKCPAKK